MSNQPKKMVRNSCLDETPSSTPVVISSLTNAKYQRNLKNAKRAIAKNNRRYIAERKRVASLIIKDSAIESAFADVLDSFDYSLCPDCSEIVLKTALRSAMERIAEPSLQAKELYLHSVKKAKSVKLHNIRFNLIHCLDTISESYLADQPFNSKILSYVLAVILFVKNTIQLMTINISEIDAVLLSCIYSYKKPVTIDDIYTRMKTSKLLDKYEITSKKQVKSHLDELIKLRTLDFDGNIYYLIEEVIL